jgi:uncharacterized protein YcbK (DUF882 family)
MPNQYYIPYFTEQELACRGTGKLVLAPGFADKLIHLRKRFNQPMIVTSCCRSKEYNKQIGGNLRSFHVYDQPYHPTGGTCAIDIAITDGSNRGKLIHIAWQLGWSIGINKSFIHLDRRIDYTSLQQTTFFY